MNLRRRERDLPGDGPNDRGACRAASWTEASSARRRTDPARPGSTSPAERREESPSSSPTRTSTQRSISDEPGAASALKAAYAGWTKGGAALLLAVRALARAEGSRGAVARRVAALPARARGATRRGGPVGSTKGWRWIGEMDGSPARWPPRISRPGSTKRPPRSFVAPRGVVAGWEIPSRSPTTNGSRRNGSSGAPGRTSPAARATSGRCARTAPLSSGGRFGPASSATSRRCRQRRPCSGRGSSCRSSSRRSHTRSSSIPTASARRTRRRCRGRRNVRLDILDADARGHRRRRAGLAQWCQLYVFQDRGVTREHLAGAEAAGCSAVVLTVDTPRLAQRERDLRAGFEIPAELPLPYARSAIGDAPQNPADQFALSSSVWWRDASGSRARAGCPSS